MKSIIFWAFGILVFLNLDAFSKTFEEDAFSTSHLNAKVDMVPVVLFKIKPEIESDIVFKVAISSSLLELEEKTQIDNSLISRVAILMNYKF